MPLPSVAYCTASRTIAAIPEAFEVQVSSKVNGNHKCLGQRRIFRFFQDKGYCVFLGTSRESKS